MENSKIIGGLNDLLTRNYDAKEGYAEAANGTSHKKLREWLLDNSVQRERFTKTLENQIKMLDGEPDRGSSFLSTLHRAWIDIKSDFTSEDDVILTECMRGEEKAVEDYEKVLTEITLPLNIRDILSKQRSEIEFSLENLKAIEKTLKMVDK